MNKLRYLVVAAARRGPRFVADYVQEVLWFDLRHRTRTALRVPKEDLERGGQEDLDGGLYVASFTGVIRELLDSVRAEIGSERFDAMQFVDLGCGKGKALLVYALEYAAPQSPIALGIENDRQLAATAQRNLSRCGVDARVDVRVANAAHLTDHLTPGDGELLVYFYNSFDGKTFDATLDALASRSHHFLYVDPRQLEVLKERGYQITRRSEGPYAPRCWLIATWAVGDCSVERS